MSMRAAYAPLAGSIRIEPAVSFFSSPHIEEQGAAAPPLNAQVGWAATPIFALVWFFSKLLMEEA